jgi:SAM-dependent methyltransferase
MSNARRVDNEILDDLPADDPRAIHSRRDLRLCNLLMFQSTIMARLLKRHCWKAPRTIVDIGTGDGTAALSIARRLARRWTNVSMTLVDRQNIVSDATIASFAGLGWKVDRVSADVFDFFAHSNQFDLVTANLFVHHFSDERLARLLAMIARSTQAFVAGEPRRGPVAAFGCRLLPLFGCNEVTLHDSAASVRAGFHGKELSALWPEEAGWRLAEHEAVPFSHCFAAIRTGASG